jgi:hypothetical protein
MCAPKIGAAPVAGQALLPKKTLRRKVSLGKHYVRWANVCQGKANELTDVLKVPGLRTLPGVSFLLEICLHRRLTKSADERPAAGCSRVLGGLWDSDLDVEFKVVGVGSFAWRRHPAGIAAYIGMEWRTKNTMQFFALSSRAVSKPGRRKYVGCLRASGVSRSQNRGSLRPTGIPRRRCSTRRPRCRGGRYGVGGCNWGNFIGKTCPQGYL